MCDLITHITFQYGCLNKPSNDKEYYYEDMLPVQPLAAIIGFREKKIGFPHHFYTHAVLYYQETINPGFLFKSVCVLEKIHLSIF